MQRLPSPLALLLGAGTLLALASCGGSSSSTPPLVTGTIGSAGGTLRIASGTLAGTQLTVPDGALAMDTWLSIDLGQRSNIPGVTHLGDAALIEPTETTFGLPATVTVPFDPQRLPPAATADQVQMGFRNDVGMVSILPAAAVDLVSGRVSAQTLGLGTFWALAPDIVDASELLPLNDGDTYTYDNGLIVTVARTSTEPNLPPTNVAKVFFVETGRTTGWYLQEDAGAIETYGNFETGFGQEINVSDVLLLPAEVQLGYRDSMVTSYNGFRPVGSPIIAYTGIRLETTSVEAKFELGVPAGTFSATHRVVFTSDFRNTRPEEGTRTTTLWLAPGVGPVQVQLDQGGIAKLERAVVGGRVIGN